MLWSIFFVISNFLALDMALTGQVFVLKKISRTTPNRKKHIETCFLLQIDSTGLFSSRECLLSALNAIFTGDS